MRHRKRGRRLGRSSSHRKAMLQNLASALILTERDAEFDENPPAVPGRVVTTLQKAKEVRPLVEKCVTIARRSLAATEEAKQYSVDAERGSPEYQDWRKSERWQEWANAIAPAVAARRRCVQLLGDKAAVRVLFDEIAPRFAERDGGYTRILRLAKPRLGDAGTRAMLEFVGVRDRVIVRSEKPAFDSDEDPQDQPAEPVAVDSTGDAAAAAEEEQRTGEQAEATEAVSTEEGDSAETSSDEDKKSEG